MAKRILSQIPNIITCLNLISGCLAITMAFKCYDTVGALEGWQWASFFIGAAALFDFCDGASARLLKAYSKIGAELDSLADLVSFGVAPALMIFNIMQHFGSNILCYVALLVAVFGALRLARFNVYDTGQTTFRGLPIPSAAIFLIGIAGWIAAHGYMGGVTLSIILLITSLAMVGNFKMFSLKFKNFNINENFRRYMLLLVAVIFIASYGLSGLAWTILFYVIVSFVGRKEQ